MPLYEYECVECGEITEAVRKLVDLDDTPRCSKCNAPTKRIISCTSFTLKGDGWYKDGYTRAKDKADLV
jgi:putative FmdB family regulatory protein